MPPVTRSVTRYRGNQRSRTTQAGTGARRAVDVARVMARRGMGAAARNLFFAAVPYGRQLRTAYNIGSTARRVYQNVVGRRNTGTQSKRIATRAMGRGHGTYSGPMKPIIKQGYGFLSKSQKKGFSIHFEKGGTITDPYCVYIGHASNPQVLMRRMMLGAMLKALLTKMGYAFTSVTQPLTFLFIGDKVEILIKSDQETSTVTNLSYPLAASQPDFQSLLDAIVNVWVIAVQGSTFESAINWKFVEIRYNPVAGSFASPARIPLEGATLSWQAESHLKLQNRSVPSADDDADDEVDRIPVTGYVYRFKGTGTNFKRTAAAVLGETNFEPVAEKQDGLFTYSAGVVGGATTLREPPMPVNFVRCNGFNRVNLDPGHIQDSRVKDKGTLTLARLLRMCVATDERAAMSAVAVQQELGKFNLISVEKLLETSNVTPIQLITIGYEVDYKIFGFLNVKHLTSTIGEHYFGTTPS